MVKEKLRSSVRQRLAVLILAVALPLMFVPANSYSQEIIYQYDFEGGWGDWYADAGVWEVGTPTAPPNGCHGGTQCAGTVLSGYYPPSTDSRLISPSFQLPSASGEEEIRIRFWEWFSYDTYDHGVVHISSYDEGTGWSEWEPLGQALSGSSGVWSPRSLDVTSYASRRVRLGFYHTVSPAGQGYGWYIDDIVVTKKIPIFSMDFEGNQPGDIEGGWGDWYADAGVWEVGTPTAPPNGCHGGTQCVGTVLSGFYPRSTDSRLVSAPFQLVNVSPGEEIRIRFWEWFSYDTYDHGVVHISSYDEGTGWSEWEPLGQALSGSSGVWSPRSLDVTSYASRRVRLGFYHTVSPAGQGYGWYIDDIRLPGNLLTVIKEGNGLGTVTSLPPGISCGGACSASFADGQAITLTATPDPGSVFSVWSGACGGATDTCILTITDDTTVTATFTSDQYALNIIKSGTGTGTVTGTGIDCGTDCTESYDGGTPVTLSANPSIDSVFSGWSGGGCSGTGICEVTMNSDITVTATFTLANAPPEPTPTEGTIGTQITITGSGFGTKKGKVLINGLATKIAKNGWTDTRIICTVTKAPPVGGPYDITIVPKTTSPITIPDSFMVKNPELDLPLSIDHGAPGTPITITGNFFGTKKGKVYLEYDKDGKIKKKNCKVTSWSMVPATGESTLTFIVPKGLLPNLYPLKVTNKVGEAETSFTTE